MTNHVAPEPGGELTSLETVDSAVSKIGVVMTYNS